MINQVLDNRYRIDSVIGQGGFSVVYRGEHLLMERPVAIKMLLSRHATATSDEYFQRFRLEAINTCKVEHPNAIIVHDFVIVDGTPFMVMEYLEGKTLKEVFEQHPLPLVRIYALFTQIGAALSKAHSAGVVHRDLKPDNIMILEGDDGEQRVKVLDFGIAKLVDAAAEDDRALTQRGMVVGTPRYMSPEQAEGNLIDGRSDIYALGVMLYELLAGHPPFTGPDMALLLKQVHEPPPPLTLEHENPKVGAAVCDLVRRALEKEPDARFESVMELMTAFRDAVYGPPQPTTDNLAVPSQAGGQRSYAMEELLAALDQAKRDFNRGNYLSVFQRLDPLVENGVSDPKIIHLAVLSLANSGATEQATDYFTRYRQHLPLTEDFRAIEARLFKDRFRQAPDGEAKRALGRQARDAYRAIYQDTQGYFTAINAATLSLLIGEENEARRLAEEALQRCAQADSEDYWVHATRAEASLLLGRTDELARHLDKAMAAAGKAAASLSTTYRQLALICDYAAIDPAVIETIRPPAVIHYTGHMIHGIGSSPGIDPDDVDNLQARIRDTLDREKAGFAFGSLACGADILVAEAVLARGGELTVILPFAAEDFLKTSVAPAGSDWERRFHHILERARRVVTIPGELCGDHELRFQLAALRAMGSARLQAETLGSKLMQLSVFNGHETNRPAGTGADTAFWRRLRLESHVIDVSSPRRGVEAVKRHAASSGPSVKRQSNAILMGTLLGARNIPEPDQPILKQAWSSRLGDLIHRAGDAILYYNTWNDSVCLVVGEIAEAAHLAKTLANMLESLPDPFSDRDIGVRVVMHAGPMFADVDGITGGSTFYGTTVETAVELNPNTPINSIYVTEDFAAYYAMTADRRFRCEHAGEYRSSDGAREIRMYSFR